MQSADIMSDTPTASHVTSIDDVIPSIMAELKVGLNVLGKLGTEEAEKVRMEGGRWDSVMPDLQSPSTAYHPLVEGEDA